jgi:hypothetical protein
LIAAESIEASKDKGIASTKIISLPPSKIEKNSDISSKVDTSVVVKKIVKRG